MSLTTDPDDPGLGRHAKGAVSPQNESYLVFPEEVRAAGCFVRPVRQSYLHPACGTVTSMALPIAETFAINPGFYQRTYCAGCRRHLPVGEFLWDKTAEKVGS